MNKKHPGDMSATQVSRESGYKVTGLDTGRGNNAVWFSGKYRDTIFGDSMIQYSPDNNHKNIDNIQEYLINSSGHRGPEFSKGTDLLFAGCSFTYGLGIPENGIWGAILANRRGLTYNNISRGGASIPWIIRELFAYFKKYGNPKTLLCLFPGLTRTFIASNPDILEVGGPRGVDRFTKDLDDRKSVCNIDLGYMAEIEDRPLYSKRPHLIEDVISADILVQISMQNIRMLEQYCRSSGIEFLWGTWSGGFAKMLEEQKLSEIYDFSHYVSMQDRLWARKIEPSVEDRFYGTLENAQECKASHGEVDCSCHVQCHLDYIEAYPDAFYMGTDNLISSNNAHYGVHRHLHYADLFEERLSRDY